MSRIRVTVIAGIATAALLAVPASGASTTTVLVKDDFFSPSSKTAKKGAAVSFKWRGKSPHDVIAIKNGKRVWSISIRSKGTVTKRFNSKGTYKLICSIHAPDMNATIRVR